MIILLDLNYTLVSNSDKKLAPFTRQIDQETYRADLIEALKGHTVILVTARPDKYRAQTMRRIKEQLNWLPAASYFNRFECFRPPMAKQQYLQYIYRRFGKDAPYFAIESNPQTRAMYARNKIRAMSLEEMEANGKIILGT